MTAYEMRISDWSSDVCSSDLAVTAEQPEEIAALLASMDDHLAHTPWRVVHTDPFTPEAFSARLALDGYAEQPAVIQMVLSRQLQAVPGSDSSEERRVGNEGVSRLRYRWGSYTSKKKTETKTTDRIIV